MTQDEQDLDFGLADDEPTQAEVESAAEQADEHNEQDNQTERVGDVEQIQPDAEVVLADGDTEEAKAAREAAKAEAEAKAADEKAQADLAAFKVAADAALASEDRDLSTGTVPVVVISALRTLYLALPGAKYKSPAKDYLQGKMQECMLAGTDDPSKYVDARTYLQLFNELKDAKATKTAGAVVAKVDPLVAFVEQVAALMLAPNLVPVPEGVGDNWTDEVEKLVASLDEDVVKYRTYQAALAEHTSKGDKAEGDAPAEPEVSAVVKQAARVAVGRVTAPRKPGSNAASKASTGTPRPASAGKSGNVGTHLKEAMASFEIGAFASIADLCKVVTSQYGGDKPAPSAGAIAAKLDKNIGLEFLRPVPKEQYGKRGIVRVS